MSMISVSKNVHGKKILFVVVVYILTFDFYNEVIICVILKKMSLHFRPIPLLSVVALLLLLFLLLVVVVTVLFVCLFVCFPKVL